MKTKITYVAHTEFFNFDARGNSKPVKVGTVYNQKQFAALTPQKQAKFNRVEVTTGRVRFGGHARELPVINGQIKTTFAPTELELLPVEVHNLVNEVAPMFETQTGYKFPGVFCGKYQADGHLTWFISGDLLPETATPMFTTSNHMTTLRAKRDRKNGGYQFRTAALLKVAERLRAGRPVFATPEEAIDRLLAG
jgi:hypothetical protein